MKKRNGEKIRDRYSKIYLILLAFCVLITLIMTLRNSSFVSVRNFISMAHQMAITANIAYAVTLVIIVQATDLSVGANLAFAVMVGAVANQAGVSGYVCLLIMVAVCTVTGVVNGILISYLNISPFIATFAMQQLLRGLTIFISDSSSVPAKDASMFLLGGELFDIPISIYVTLFFLLFWQFILKRTVYGRNIYAVGGNFSAARASGIDARFIRFTTFVATGFMVGICSILYMGRIQSAQPLAGQGLEFDVLTAVFIGGAVVSGGSGRPLGALLGTFLITIIKTAMNFFWVQQSVTYIVTGAFVLLAVIAYQTNTLNRIKLTFSQFASSLKSSHRKQSLSKMNAEKKDHTIELEGITKEFSGFVALNDISTRIHSGEMIGLIGENGAGKSTFVNILSGVFQQSAGTIRIDGEETRFYSPKDSQNAGIGVIHQHYSLISELDISQNLFYNHEPQKWGFVRRKLMLVKAKKLMDSFGLNIPVTTKIYQLTVGQRQMIEVVKATISDPWLLIMDEPTSSLSKVESERLYELIDQVQKRNVAIIYISHKMAEIFKLCHRALVLRDGCLVGEVNDLADITEDGLVNMMVGREIEQIFPYTEAVRGEEAIRVEELCDGSLIENVSFNVRHGELVVLAGLMGAGRTEVMESLCGLHPMKKGRIFVNGKQIKPSPTGMLENGIAFIPEDRHAAGIIPHMTIADNLALIWNRVAAKHGVLDVKSNRAMVQDMIHKMNVKPAEPQKEVIYLSGGNQQKVVLGKCLAASPKIILLDDPTRGVDVGAKSEIHLVISELKKAGAAILMISSELPELLNVADRIYVMHKGRIVKELAHGATENEVMHYAFGLEEEVAG